MGLDGDEVGTKIDEGAPRGKAVFAAGDIVAGRYHIVRFIAEGGMGEVYEARDTELAEQLALKTIRSEYAKRPLLLARFKREIHVARQVTHPNVCRVYDLGQHHGIVFLTMQLLDGDTLATVIHRRRMLRTDEALPIARQIAAGIMAAHRAGVVHRDLKPGNVMLLPPAPGTSGPRAVVTDFGLARAYEDDPEHDLSLTGDDAPGSPAYMAPEQVKGDEVGPPADIYSFGIILFEMVTGARPFDGKGTISVASRRLVQPPPSPREFVPGLDADWERTILRCLEIDPARRFATAVDVIASLQGELGRPRGRRVWLGVAAASALAIGGAAGVLFVKSGESKPAAASTSGRRAVAVIGFKNLAARADTAWISSALSEMFATELGGTMRAVTGQDVGRARIELGLADTDAFNAATLGRIRADLRADIVIVGSYLAFGNQHDRVRLDVRIQDTKKGETLATISEQGATAQLPDLVERTSTKLRVSLGLGPVAPSQRSELRAALPTKQEAARLYAEGKDKLHRLDVLAARDAFEEAARIEPDHPMIRAALAEAWAQLGYDSKARDQAKLALAHAERLAPSERMFVEARYHLSAREWDPAIAAFRTLAEASPDDPDAVVQLAHAQIAAQRPRDALATLASIRIDDPRIDLEAARAYSLLSDLPAQRDAAARAADKADRSGATLLAARARLEQASATLALRDHAKTLELIDLAERAFKQANEVRGLAYATHARGLVFFVQGKLVEADELETKAARYFREVGSVQPLSRALLNLGVIASRRSDSALALTRFNEAIEVARSADDRWVLALALSGLADTERLLGNLDAAGKHEAEALEHARATHARRAEGYIVQTLGQIALARGDLALAEQHAREALAIAEAVGERTLISTTEVELGRIRLEANDLLGSREHLQRALTGHTKAAEAVDAAIAETELARVDLADGIPADAIERALRATTALEKAPTDLANTLAVLAQAQLAAGKLAAARATVVKAGSAGKAAYPDGRIRAAIAIAAVQSASGDARAARATIEAARGEATRLGLGLLALYCQLAEARLDRGGKAKLQAIAETAKGRGLLRIAELAAKP